MSRRVLVPPPRHRVIPGAQRTPLSTDFVPAFHQDLQTILEAAYHLQLAYEDVAALAQVHGIQATADTLLPDLEAALAGRAAALAARMGAAARKVKNEFGGEHVDKRRRELCAELMALVDAPEAKTVTANIEIPF